MLISQNMIPENFETKWGQFKMKKTIFIIITVISILAISMINISAAVNLPTLTDSSNVIPDVYPVGNLTITSGYTIPDIGTYMVVYNGANYAGETNDSASDSGHIYRIQTNSTANPGEYITYTDVGGRELNKYGRTVTFTISNVLWNKSFDYLPEIYIPNTLDELTALWYTNEPLAYVSFRVRSVSTGVVIKRENVKLLGIKTFISADKYYKMSDIFRDPVFENDSYDMTYLNDLIIENLSITFFKQTDTRFDVSSVRVRYKTFKSYLDTNGVMQFPLKDYYNYFLIKPDTSNYDEGYQDGYDKGKFEGDRDGFNRGYNVGKQAGHEEGYNEGATKGFDFTSWIGNTLSGIMNVQFGFISLGSVVGIVVAILLVRWIIKIIGG